MHADPRTACFYARRALELFHVAYWLGSIYHRVAGPVPGLLFDANALPKAAAAPKQTAEQLQQLVSPPPRSSIRMTTPKPRPATTSLTCW